MYTAKKVSQIRTLKIVTLIENLKVFCLHTPSVPDFKHNMNFEHIMFTNHIVFKSGTLFVYKQNTFRCSISVTIFSVLIWDTFFAVIDSKALPTEEQNTSIICADVRYVVSQ